MSYQHGIYIKEALDLIKTPTQTTSGLQVIIGTAPINLAANPVDAVNKPILVNDLNEAKAAVGYCDDFEKYTLC